MQAIPMTLRGAEKLREELDFLKSVRRPEIIAAIAEAREHGDLKENAEYHAAREQQGFCEGRIKDIEAKLSNAQVIDVTKMPNNGRVIFGATVTVLNLDSDEEQTVDKDAIESIHLCDFPTVNEAWIDKDLEADMKVSHRWR